MAAVAGLISLTTSWQPEDISNGFVVVGSKRESVGSRLISSPDSDGSSPLRGGTGNVTIGGHTVLDTRRMTIALLMALLMLIVAGSDASGASLPVEISNRTPLDTGDFSLAIETDQYGNILLTGKFLSKTTAGERIVGNVLLDV
jgi:hypothetical protein